MKMVEKSRLMEKVTNALDNIEGIIEVSNSLNKGSATILDTECVLAQYENMIRALEDMDLYLEESPENEIMKDVKKRVDRLAGKYRKLFVDFLPKEKTKEDSS